MERYLGARHSPHLAAAAERLAISVAEEATNPPPWYQQVFDDLPVAIYTTDTSGLVTFFNKAAEELAGRAPKIGTDRWCIASRLYRPNGTPLPLDECSMAIALKQNRIIRGEEAIAERPDGSRFAYISFSTPARNAAGEVVSALHVLLDITDRKQAELKLAHVAHHDLLTGLPNRLVFSERLAEAINMAKVTSSSFAMVCIDLDLFKDINDTFGHAVGDEVLKTVADRLKQAAGETFVGRIGGDAFVLIVPETDKSTLIRRLTNLQSVIGAKIVIAGHELWIKFRAGVAIAPQDGLDEIEIVAHADAALRQAKRDPGQLLRFFDADIKRRISDRSRLQEDLRATIEGNRLELHYQPLATSRGQIVGFEALTRWNHPVEGNISPGTFIPISEECGLILPLSHWMLRRACSEAASWKRPLRLAVNLSPVQFQHEDVPLLIESVLRESGLAPNRLELEITEGILLSDSDRALETLRRLRNLGVGVALDDFGTGYSSLCYLRDFPLSKIKIDKSFVDKIGVQASAKAIIHAVIGLGHSMNIEVTAEGVETEKQLEYLLDEGCDLIQGYLVGRPAPIDSFSALTGNVKRQDEFSYGANGRRRQARLVGHQLNYTL